MNSIKATLLVLLTASLGFAQPALRLKLTHKEFLEGLTQMAKELKPLGTEPVCMGVVSVGNGNSVVLAPAADKWGVSDMADVSAAAASLAVSHDFDLMFHGKVQNLEEILKGANPQGKFVKAGDRVIELPFRYLATGEQLSGLFGYPQDKVYHPCPQTPALGNGYYPALIRYENLTYAWAKELCKDVKTSFMAGDTTRFLAHQEAFYRVKNSVGDVYVLELVLSYQTKGDEISVKSVKLEMVNASDSDWLKFAGRKEASFRAMAMANSNTSVSLSFGKPSPSDDQERANRKEAEKAAAQKQFEQEAPQFDQYFEGVRKSFVSKGVVEALWNQKLKEFFKDYVIAE